MSKPNTHTKSHPPLEIQRLPIRFVNDERRVITRPFFPGGETRIGHVVERVNQLSEAEVQCILGEVFADFGGRHRDIDSVFEEQYEAVIGHTGKPSRISSERRLLIGAYFTMEYSIQSAALFNPSIVSQPAFARQALRKVAFPAKAARYRPRRAGRRGRHGPAFGAMKSWWKKSAQVGSGGPPW